MRASIRRLAKARVRPSAPGTTAAAQAIADSLKEQPSKPPTRRWGLLFLLGGLAAASWMAKPPTEPPAAALDPFKLPVAIVFVVGESAPHEHLAQLADKLGYAYLPNPTYAAVEEATKGGKTRLIIDNVDPKKLAEFEKDVVACDLVLDWSGSSSSPDSDGPLASVERSRRLANMKTSKASVEDILRQHNLV